jgi:release factor glutamine methyltransferase
MMSAHGATPQIAAGTTIAAARRMLAKAFAAAGLENPELDARVLLGYLLGLDHADLNAAAQRPLAADKASSLTRLAARRLAHEPVARILGIKEFWSLPIVINPAVLVPRPETETLVELALASIDQGPGRNGSLQVADLGTGSGALLLALLHELPRAFGVGTDVSIPALETARTNARRLGLDRRAAFVASDFGAALRGPFDLVVSNPPYVRSHDLPALPHEVRGFDPPSALDGGSDGLAAYRAIAADGMRLLAPRGHLVVELGATQEHDVARLFAAAGFAVPHAARRDLAGIPRALHIQRAASP